MIGTIFQAVILFMLVECLMTICNNRGGTLYQKYKGQGRPTVFKSVPQSAGNYIQCASACLTNEPRCIGFHVDKEKKICDLIDSVVLTSPSEQSDTPIYISASYKPVEAVSGLDLEVNYPLGDVTYVAALPSNQAAVYVYTSSNRTRTVLRVDGQGRILQELYVCTRGSHIRGLLVLQSDLFVVHDNGTVIQMQPQDGLILHVYNVPVVNGIRNHATLYTDPYAVDPHMLLLVDDDYTSSAGQVFTYNITSHTKQVRVTGLPPTTSISHYVSESNKLFYIVCVMRNHAVNIYNDEWELVTIIGGRGTRDGQLIFPRSAVMSPDHIHIIVADHNNHRVSMFTIQGVFVRHLLTAADGITYPYSLSASSTHVWVADNANGKLYKYRL